MLSSTLCDDRGYLRAGAVADVAVFDADRIRDRATYEQPRQVSEGAVHVLVNGRFAIRNGAPTGALAGRPIRRPTGTGGVDRSGAESAAAERR